MRWPAWAMAVLFLGYASGKAVFAAHGKLGFPGGPRVPAGEYEVYAREVMDVATAQWLAAANGLLGAVLVVATVTVVGHRLPRWLMLPALGLALVGVGAAAVVMVGDGFLGFGVGWSWCHGVLGIVALALMAATVWSYVREGRHVAG